MDKITIERETLLPCPFCGANAEILTIPEDHPDAGAMFVQCCDSRCMTSSALLYPLMDDVRALLVERWNRRAALAAQPAPAAVPLTDEQIKDALLQYRCAHFQDEDGGLPLTDALAHAFGDTDITRAKHEIEMIVDAIAAAAAGDKP